MKKKKREKSQLKQNISQTSLLKKRPLVLSAQGSKRVRAARVCRTATLPSGAGRPWAPSYCSQTASSPLVLGSESEPPVVAAVAGSLGELQIEACWEHSLLLPGNVLCPAPQEAPARRQWAASPSASPRPHRRRTGRQAWAVRSELPGASQVGAPLRLGAPASRLGSWGPELII